jgi:hypothetical protein
MDKNTHIAPPQGFPCDMGITIEELNVDEYTREQARQSEFFFNELCKEIASEQSDADLARNVVDQMNEEAAFDERRIFDQTHPCGANTTTTKEEK